MLIVDRVTGAKRRVDNKNDLARMITEAYYDMWQVSLITLGTVLDFTIESGADEGNFWTSVVVNIDGEKSCSAYADANEASEAVEKVIKLLTAI